MVDHQKQVQLADKLRMRLVNAIEDFRDNVEGGNAEVVFFNALASAVIATCFQCPDFDRAHTHFLSWLDSYVKLVADMKHMTRDEAEAYSKDNAAKLRRLDFKVVPSLDEPSL